MADLLKINKEQIRESMNRFTWSLNFLAEPKAYVLESFDERSEYISKLKETYSLYLMLVDEMTESFGKDLCTIGEAINSISTVDTKLSGGIEEDILQVSPISIVKTNYYGSKTIGSRELRSDHIKEIEDLIRTELNIISGKLDNYINEIKAFEEIDFKGMLATSIRSYLQEEHLSLIKKVLLMGEEIIEDIRKYNQDVELILNESGHYVLIESAFVSFIDEVTRDMNEYEDAINEYNKAIMSFMYDEPSINGIPKPKLQLISRAEVDDTLMEYNELREISRRELEGIEAVESRGLERLGLLDTKLNNMRINISEITKDGIANYSNGKNITSFAPVSSREEDKFIPEVVIEEMRATGLVPENAAVPVSLAQQYFDLKERLINMGLPEEDINFITSQRLRLYYGNSAEISFDSELSQWISKALEALRIRTCFYQLLNGDFDEISTEDLGELSYYIHEHVCHDVKVSESALRGLARVIAEVDAFDEYDESTRIAIIRYLLTYKYQQLEDIENALIPENYRDHLLNVITSQVTKSVASLCKAVEWIIGIANDPSHGYDMSGARRFSGIDYDCSSLVISALEYGGINNRKSNGDRIATNTYNMLEEWLNRENGFILVENYNLSTGEGLEPGDIFMKTNHTGMYVGDLGDGPVFVEASHNELVDEEGDYCYTDGEFGDQLQNQQDPIDGQGEIGIRPLQNASKFTAVYRYVGV